MTNRNFTAQKDHFAELRIFFDKPKNLEEVLKDDAKQIMLGEKTQLWTR